MVPLGSERQHRYFVLTDRTGNMGVAILSGIFASLAARESSDAPTDSKDAPKRLPTRFIACVRRPESVRKAEAAFADYPVNVSYLVNDNLKGVQQSDVILLGCKPYMLRDILTVEGMREALAGKLLISILAGVSVAQIEDTLYGSSPHGQDRCRTVRVMPNTAAAVRESMTVVATSSPPLSDEQASLVTWVFSRVGRVVHLPPASLDASTALCGSGPAFMALVLEAMADGAVAMGLPRAEAQSMAAQTMKGAAALVLNGEHPAVLKDKVATPGGCTIGGLMVLEEGRVRGSVSRAIREVRRCARSTRASEHDC